MQPIRGSTFLEEAGESMVPPALASATEGADMVVEHLVVEHLVLEQAVVELEHAVASADAQILSAKEAAAAPRGESSPPTSELSIGKMNPWAPGWNKRLRIGAAAPSRTPCPKPCQCI
ncbi:hypothetical protein VPH35_044318 [Triticum aestivum]